MKIVFIRFLLVCWVLVGFGAACGVISGLLNLNLETIQISVVIALFFAAIIAAMSFVFLGTLNPKNLYKEIRKK